MYRFFVQPSQIQDGYVTIVGEDVKHICQVLRMKAGEEIRISNGIDKDYYCIIREFHKDSVIAQVCYEERQATELPARIHLYQGLPKGDKMEWILQKAVELGVYEVIPVSMKRCVVKLDAKKAQNKQKRWQSIAESAAKQSKRLIIPTVCEVMSFSQALEHAGNCAIKLLPYENERGMEMTRQIVGDCKAGMEIAVFIGPEGGFDETEVKQAVEIGWQPISLGNRILRTETAGLTMLSILMYQLEN